MDIVLTSLLDSSACRHASDHQRGTATTFDAQQEFIRKPMFEQRRCQRGATREDKVRAVLRLDVDVGDRLTTISDHRGLGVRPRARRRPSRSPTAGPSSPTTRSSASSNLSRDWRPTDTAAATATVSASPSSTPSPKPTAQNSRPAHAPKEAWPSPYGSRWTRTRLSGRSQVDTGRPCSVRGHRCGRYLAAACGSYRHGRHAHSTRTPRIHSQRRQPKICLTVSGSNFVGGCDGSGPRGRERPTDAPTAALRTPSSAGTDARFRRTMGR